VIRGKPLAPGFGIGDRTGMVLAQICRAGGSHRAGVNQRRYATLQPFLPGQMRPGLSRNRRTCRRAFPGTRIAVARARTRSRIVSCAASGTQTAVNAPARCNLAGMTASRRPVSIRSPACTGRREGAAKCNHAPARQAGDRGRIRTDQPRGRTADGLPLAPVSPPACGRDRTAAEPAPVTDLCPAFGLPDRDRNPRLTAIRSDEHVMLLVASPAFSRRGSRPIRPTPPRQDPAPDTAEPVSSRQDRGGPSRPSVSVWPLSGLGG
jgi:hypothetical protein